MRYVPSALASIAVVSLLSAAPAPALELGLPAQCELGKTCFMQQYPDMDAGAGVADPLCGSQSYDGHKGTDLRILSMKDMEKGYAVIAVADGKVLRVRDGEADHLVETEEDRARIAGKECGNGIVMQLAEGYEVQYCHLRKGSLAVRPGAEVRKGDRLGEVGSSGFAQFPHVHITLSHGGEPLDPLTGRKLSQGCTSTAPREASLFSPDIVEKLNLTRPDILASGLAGAPVDHQALVKEGPPPQVVASDRMFVAWAWFTNLGKGSTIRLVLKDGQGNTLVDYTSEPLDRDKATFSAFAGRKRTLPPGRYVVDVSVTRSDAVLRSASTAVTIE
ncbi:MULTISPECIES: M23 family metallopeptidase [unclassified Shinella]|uniref:M23 family metallopeptidase n=1 Tax=unclassified Shinella TaxID=2643062 RepID=UPI00225D1E7B|nr:MULTISPECIES: M23 family metallopeptidase [unclassified Shinella]MCO5153660.1 M23 family metallopeptidase [Shinella sp.]MDC7259917.1 M23 family metallopeptidase [Shinella sp. YE25]CAI0341735.1 Peptidase_M23 domain-containing protein [Rhizobiaceae bacterium]CAK7262052.1 Peptidase M23 domain-containing protein [Shinella sp. WSC3-e]